MKTSGSNPPSASASRPSLSERRVNWSLKLWRCMLSSLAPPLSFSVQMNLDLVAAGIRCLNSFEAGGPLLPKPGSCSMEPELVLGWRRLSSVHSFALRCLETPTSTRLPAQMPFFGV